VSDAAPVTRLLVATTNPDKRREIHGLLAHVAADVNDLTALPPLPAPDESGATFQDNARAKALYYSGHASQVPAWRHDNVLTVAEDSGLVIDALGGDPGVRSARYLRSDATYEERFAEIERRLAHVPDAVRTARFECALAVARGREIVFETTGVIEGTIAQAPRGTGGFGYDPIFYYPPFGATLAEVSESDKLRVAHRGHAFRALVHWLRDQGIPNEAKPQTVEDAGPR
jgi:XTP/dITP diphosphohydrolase